MLSISQLCCLHEAVKERMPLPKRTLIKTVERAFSLENWSPKNNNGFTFYDETSDEFKGISLTYCIQTQRWNSLSFGRLQDDRTSSFQTKYNSAVQQNQQLVERITDALFEVRIDACLNTALSNETNRRIELGTSHETVDALLHLHPRQLSYVNTISERFKKPFDDGLWILDGMQGYEWNDSEINEFLFAVKTQINTEPSGSLTQTVSKKQEPEYRADEEVSSVTFDFLARLCNQLINDVSETTSFHQELSQNIFHILIRLGFTKNWPIFENTAVGEFDFDEMVRTYEKGDKIISPTLFRDAIILSVLRRKGIQKYGVKKIRNFFELILTKADLDSETRKSVEFNRDNLTLRGDNLIDSLRIHRSEAASPFLKAVISYTLGTKLNPKSNDRISLLISSIGVFF